MSSGKHKRRRAPHQFLLVQRVLLPFLLANAAVPLGAPFLLLLVAWPSTKAFQTTTSLQLLSSHRDWQRGDTFRHSSTRSESEAKRKRTDRDRDRAEQGRGRDDPVDYSYVRWHTPEVDQTIESGIGTADSLLGVASLSNFALQTAVTTFRKDNQIVELHAQLHLGSPSYFDYYNQHDAFRNNKDAILYELLLDETLLQDVDVIRHPNRPRRRRVRPEAPIQASPSDQALAAQYGWVCQADAVQYSTAPSNFYHADLTRQECLRMLDSNSSSSSSSRRSNNNKNTGVNNRPLWQFLTAPANHAPIPFLPSAASEATTALLVGPPVFQPTQRRNSASISRRIFTNLFLPGDALAVWLRLVLWLAVPCPELSILLLDWSSTWSVVRGNNKNNNNQVLPRKQVPAPTKTRFSRVLLPIVQALAAGRFQQVRQLVFGQVIVSGHHSTLNNDDDDHSLLIGQRNDHALTLLQDQLSRNDHGQQQQQQQRIALLYGCNHCPDLHVKLCRMGFAPIHTEWRTAWSVQLQETKAAATASFATANQSTNHPSTNSLGLGFILLFLYLTLGGADWIGTLQEVGTALGDGDNNANPREAAVLAALYLARHVLLYVGLSKWVLDFTKHDDDDRE